MDRNKQKKKGKFEREGGRENLWRDREEWFAVKTAVLESLEEEDPFHSSIVTDDDEAAAAESASMATRRQSAIENSGSFGSLFYKYLQGHPSTLWKLQVQGESRVDQDVTYSLPFFLEISSLGK